MIDRIELITENDFQRFCSVLLSADDPTFAAVDGSGGDLGNDGFQVGGDRLYQAYGPARRERVKVRKKIAATVQQVVGLRAGAFPNLRTIIFLTPFDLTVDMHEYLQATAKRAMLNAEPWGGSRLASTLAKHPHIRSLFPRFLMPDLAGEIHAVRNAVETHANRAATEAREHPLGPDFEPNIQVLQPGASAGVHPPQADAFFRLRLYADAFARRSFEPEEEEAFRDTVRRHFEEDANADLEDASNDRVLVQHGAPQLRFHRRWGWWTMGAVGMAATLRDLTRENVYSVADLTVDVARFVTLATTLRSTGNVRIVLGVAPGQLRPVFDPSDIVARERFGARVAAPRDLGRPIAQRPREIPFEVEYRLEDAATNAVSVAATLVVEALRHIHEARISLKEFTTSMPALLSALHRARSR